MMIIMITVVEALLESIVKARGDELEGVMRVL